MNQQAARNDPVRLPDPPDAPALDALPRERLEVMRDAGRDALECQRVLAKGGLNLVGEILREQGTFYTMRHYPKGDVYDRDTHSQYYYHAHRKDGAEHGHFHTFLRTAGMPAGIEPAAVDDRIKRPMGKDALSHLIGISMDRHGHAIGLFAVNRWVTGESWYSAADVIAMLDRFAIDHAKPSWPTNRWLTAMFRLFRAHIEALLWHRDATLATWAEQHPGRLALEDRELEVTAALPVNVEAQLHAVEQALEATGKGTEAVPESRATGNVTHLSKPNHRGTPS